MSEGQKKGLDALLEQALASYAKADPPPDLAQRTLSRICHQPPQKHLGWRLPLWASAAAIGAISLLAVLLPTETRKPLAIQTKRELPAPLLHVPFQVAQARAVPIAVRKRTHRRVSLPKKMQFPTPAPLTEEEKALQRLVQEKDFSPDLLVLGKPIEPLRIAAIEIKPLKENENE